MSRVVGIDPGLSGALAMIDRESRVLIAVEDVSTADGRVLAGDLADVLVEWRPDWAVIEAVHSMPRQGVASSFKFGRAFGCIEGVVETLRIPLDSIAPHHWKRIAGVTKDKGSCRARASRLWPQRRELFARVKDDGRAEAALIANAWCDRVQQSSTWHNNDEAGGD